MVTELTPRDRKFFGKFTRLRAAPSRYSSGTGTAPFKDLNIVQCNLGILPSDDAVSIGISVTLTHRRR